MSLLLIVLIILVVVAFGLGFVVKWLFILAAILLLLALISFFTSRSRV